MAESKPFKQTWVHGFRFFFQKVLRMWCMFKALQMYNLCISQIAGCNFMQILSFSRFIYQNKQWRSKLYNNCKISFAQKWFPLHQLCKISSKLPMSTRKYSFKYLHKDHSSLHLEFDSFVKLKLSADDILYQHST